MACDIVGRQWEEEYELPGRRGPERGATGPSPVRYPYRVNHRSPVFSQYPSLTGRRRLGSMGVSTIIRDYGTEILNAIRDNDLPKLRAILEKQLKSHRKISQLCVTDIKHRPSKKFACPLILAARLDDCKILQYMMECGVDPNFVHHTIFSSKRREIITALHISVDMAHYDSTEVLMNANADPNIYDHNQETPLHIAVKKADRVMTRLLLSKGADPSVPDKKGNASLHIATLFGHLQLVRTLLKYDADIFQKGQWGAIPPHIAAREGHMHLIPLFASGVGNLNIKIPCFEDKREKGPIHLAAANGHAETVLALLDQFEADPNLKDSSGHTPLHCVVLEPYDPHRMRDKEHFTETARVLIKYNVSINEKNIYGDTALHFAAMNRYQRIVELLLEIGANPFIENGDRLKPIQVVPDSDPVTRQILKTAMLQPRPHPGSTSDLGMSRDHSRDPRDDGAAEPRMDRSKSNFSFRSSSSMSSVFVDDVKAHRVAAAANAAHKARQAAAAAAAGYEQERVGDAAQYTGDAQYPAEAQYPEDAYQQDDSSTYQKVENEISVFHKNDKQARKEARRRKKEKEMIEAARVQEQNEWEDEETSTFYGDSMMSYDTTQDTTQEERTMPFQAELHGRLNKHQQTKAIHTKNSSTQDYYEEGEEDEIVEENHEHGHHRRHGRKKVSGGQGHDGHRQHHRQHGYDDDPLDTSIPVNHRGGRSQGRDGKEVIYENLPHRGQSSDRPPRMTAVPPPIPDRAPVRSSHRHRGSPGHPRTGSRGEINITPSPVPGGGPAGDSGDDGVQMHSVPGRPGTIEVEYTGGPITIAVDTQNINEYLEDGVPVDEGTQCEPPRDKKRRGKKHHDIAVGHDGAKIGQKHAALGYPADDEQWKTNNDQMSYEDQNLTASTETDDVSEDSQQEPLRKVIQMKVEEVTQKTPQRGRGRKQYAEQQANEEPKWQVENEEQKVTLSKGRKKKKKETILYVDEDQVMEEDQSQYSEDTLEPARVVTPQKRKTIGNKRNESPSGTPSKKSTSSQAIVVEKVDEIMYIDDDEDDSQTEEPSPQQMTFAEKLAWAQRSSTDIYQSKKPVVSKKPSQPVTPQKAVRPEPAPRRKTIMAEQKQEQEEINDQEESESDSDSESTHDSSEGEMDFEEMDRSPGAIRRAREINQRQQNNVMLATHEELEETGESSGSETGSVIRRDVPETVLILKGSYLDDARYAPAVTTATTNSTSPAYSSQVNTNNNQQSSTLQDPEFMEYDDEPGMRLRSKSHNDMFGEATVTYRDVKNNQGQHIRRTRTPDSIMSEGSIGLNMHVTGEVPKTYTHRHRDTARRAWMKATPVGIESGSETSDAEFGSRNSLTDNSPNRKDRGPLWSESVARPIYSGNSTSPASTSSPSMCMSPRGEDDERKKKTKLIGYNLKPYKSFGKIETKTDALEEALSESIIPEEELSDREDPSEISSEFLEGTDRSQDHSQIMLNFSPPTQRSQKAIANHEDLRKPHAIKITDRTEPRSVETVTISSLVKVDEGVQLRDENTHGKSSAFQGINDYPQAAVHIRQPNSAGYGRKSPDKRVSFKDDVPIEQWEADPEREELEEYDQEPGARRPGHRPPAGQQPGQVKDDSSPTNPFKSQVEQVEGVDYEQFDDEPFGRRLPSNISDRNLNKPQSVSQPAVEIGDLQEQDELEDDLEEYDREPGIRRPRLSSKAAGVSGELQKEVIHIQQRDTDNIQQQGQGAVERDLTRDSVVLDELQDEPRIIQPKKVIGVPMPGADQIAPPKKEKKKRKKKKEKEAPVAIVPVVPSVNGPESVSSATTVEQTMDQLPEDLDLMSYEAEPGSRRPGARRTAAQQPATRQAGQGNADNNPTNQNMIQVEKVEVVDYEQYDDEPFGRRMPSNISGRKARAGAQRLVQESKQLNESRGSAGPEDDEVAEINTGATVIQRPGSKPPAPPGGDHRQHATPGVGHGATLAGAPAITGTSVVSRSSPMGQQQRSTPTGFMVTVVGDAEITTNQGHRLTPQLSDSNVDSDGSRKKSSGQRKDRKKKRERGKDAQPGDDTTGQPDRFALGQPLASSETKYDSQERLDEVETTDEFIVPRSATHSKHPTHPTQQMSALDQQVLFDEREALRAPSKHAPHPLYTQPFKRQQPGSNLDSQIPFQDPNQMGHIHKPHPHPQPQQFETNLDEDIPIEDEANLANTPPTGTPKKSPKKSPQSWRGVVGGGPVPMQHAGDPDPNDVSQDSLQQQLDQQIQLPRQKPKRKKKPKGSISSINSQELGEEDEYLQPVDSSFTKKKKKKKQMTVAEEWERSGREKYPGEGLYEELNVKEDPLRLQHLKREEEDPYAEIPALSGGGYKPQRADSRGDPVGASPGSPPPPLPTQPPPATLPAATDTTIHSQGWTRRGNQEAEMEMMLSAVTDVRQLREENLLPSSRYPAAPSQKGRGRVPSSPTHGRIPLSPGGSPDHMPGEPGQSWTSRQRKQARLRSFKSASPEPMPSPNQSRSSTSLTDPSRTNTPSSFHDRPPPGPPGSGVRPHIAKKPKPGGTTEGAPPHSQGRPRSATGPPVRGSPGPPARSLSASGPPGRSSGSLSSQGPGRQPIHGRRRRYIMSDSDLNRGFQSDSETSRRRRNNRISFEGSGAMSDAELQRPDPLNIKPSTSMEEAAFMQMKEDLKHQPKIGPRRFRGKKDDRPINYTRGVYRPKPLHWRGSEGNMHNTSQYTDSEIISQLWSDRHRSMTTESEGEYEEDMSYDASMAESPERASSNDMLASEGSAASGPDGLTHHQSHPRLQSSPGSGSWGHAQPQWSYRHSHSQPNLGPKKVTIIESQRRAQQQRSRREQQPQKDKAPAHIPIGPVDYSKYDAAARLWMEQVDKGKVKKSHTMYLQVTSDQPPEQLTRSLAPGQLEDPNDDMQWVVARGRRQNQEHTGAAGQTEGADDDSEPKQMLLLFRIGPNWRDLVWVLFEDIMTDGDILRMIKHIQQKHPKVLTEQVNDMMHRWWNKKGAAATIEELQRALDVLKMAYVEDDYEDPRTPGGVTDTEDDPYISEPGGGDGDEADQPEVQRLMHEYNVRSHNTSGQGSAVGSAHSTLQKDANRFSFSSNTVNNYFQQNSDKIQSKIDRSRISTGSLPRDTSMGSLPRDGAHRMDMSHDSDMEYNADGTHRQSFVIVQPQIKSGEYRHETTM